MIISLIFLGLAFLSLWVKRDPKIWGSLLILSLFSGLLIDRLIQPTGLIWIALLASLWMLYLKQPSWMHLLLILALSLAFKLHFLPGYTPMRLTSRFFLGIDVPIIGLFPLAFVVSLAKTKQDWMRAFKGFGVGCAGIALMALPAIALGATHWEVKIPSFMFLRTYINFFFAAIPEEAFYRGFLQTQFCTILPKPAALLLASAIFVVGHLHWAPNGVVLLFVFVASLLYGGVYLLSGKIESAILTHFMLNFIHMTCFGYHAM